MSTLESIIWHILGYAAIPMIFLVGIVVSSLIFYGFLKIFGSRSDDS